MSIAPRCLLGLILGALGGALGWMSTDYIFNPVNNPEAMVSPVGTWGPVLGRCMYFFWGALLGAFMCMALGAADGIQSGSRTRFSRLIVRSALAGLIGGGVGLNIGSIVFSHAGGTTSMAPGSGLTGYLVQIFIRSLSWTIFGAVFGGIYGGLESGVRKARNGAIGGAIGGLLGGLIFNPLAYALPSMFPFLSSADRVSRLVAFTLMGAFIGFFTALVNQLLKTAWVFVLYGRNEGREIILDRPVSRIGRSELAEIPVFRDGLIAANHAEIRLHDGRYTLFDAGSAVGTSVNAQKVVQPVLLKDSDLIQVGNTQVVFYERATAGPVRRQIDVAHASPAAPPVVPEGSCPFCGQRKDPITGACACSVTAGGPPAPAAGGFSPAGYGAPGQAPAAQTGTPQSAAYPSGAGQAPPVYPTQGFAPTRLLALSGPHSGESFNLAGPATSVGRDPSNTIALVRDTTVSRRHASVTASAGRVSVQDLGSSNGTFINGARISEAAARPGDEIMFGTARFRLE